MISYLFNIRSSLSCLLLVTAIQAHPWFKGIPWQKLYEIDAAFKPEVNDELDTQNFEKFEEVDTLYKNESKIVPWPHSLRCQESQLSGLH